MKKITDKLKKEGEALVTLKFMREFRAEMMSQFSAMNARFEQIDAKFDDVRAEFAQVRAGARQLGDLKF